MCIFCQIAKKEIPAKITAENETSLAFLDIQPRSPGHSLVIPKNHYKNLLEMPDKELESFFSLVKKTISLLKEKLEPDGFTVGYNHGSVAGQEIDDFHLNVIPRYKGDNGKAIQSLVTYQTNQSVDEIYERIKGGSQ